MHKHHCGGGHPPQNHDAADRFACTNLFQQEIARNLQQHVSEKKDARSQPVRRITQAEIALHL